MRVTFLLMLWLSSLLGVGCGDGDDCGNISDLDVASSGPHQVFRCASSVETLGDLRLVGDELKGKVAFPKLKRVQSIEVAGTQITELSFPMLSTAEVRVDVAGANELRSLSLPMLKNTDYLNVQGVPQLKDLDLSALSQAGGIFIESLQVESITLPALGSVRELSFSAALVGENDFQSALKELSLPMLGRVTDDVSLIFLTHLQTIHAPKFTSAALHLVELPLSELVLPAWAGKTLYLANMHRLTKVELPSADQQHMVIQVLDAPKLSVLQVNSKAGGEAWIYGAPEFCPDSQWKLSGETLPARCTQ